MAEPRPRRSLGETLKKRWRAWLRAIHRDVGYLAVGLTFIYALSGIAINHIGEWDPNFKSVVETSHMEGPYGEDEDQLAARVLEHLGLDPDNLQAAYFDDETAGIFELSLADATVRLDTTSGTVKSAGKEPRFFLRVANWLHYNRGKSAWTYIADGYAVLSAVPGHVGRLHAQGSQGLRRPRRHSHRYWRRRALRVCAISLRALVPGAPVLSPGRLGQGD